MHAVCSCVIVMYCTLHTHVSLQMYMYMYAASTFVQVTSVVRTAVYLLEHALILWLYTYKSHSALPGYSAGQRSTCQGSGQAEWEA